MASETFLITIKETGSAQVVQGINRISASTQKAVNIMALFRNALVAFAIIRAASHLVEFADAAIRIDNRLRVATTSAEDFARAQQFISRVSRETRTDLESNAVVYSRLLRSTEGLGYKTQVLENAMKSLTLAVEVGGATSMEARNAMIQLTQSLASGALRGDELRAVAEQLPPVATAIGKAFGMSGGQLIAFAKANPGIIHTKEVIDQLSKSLPEMERAFARVTPTMASGFTIIHNAAVELMGEIQKGTGIFSAFVQVLLFVGDNLKTLIELTFTWTAAWVAFKLESLILTIGRFASSLLLAQNATQLLTIAQYELDIAMAANQFGVIVIAIAAFVSALIILYNSSETVASGIGILFNWLLQLGDFILGSFSPAIDQLGAVFNFLNVIFQATIQLFIDSWNSWVEFVSSITASFPILGQLTQWLSENVVVFNILESVVKALGLALGALIIGPLLLATEAMYAIGLASEKTTKKVEDAAKKFLKLSLVESETTKTTTILADTFGSTAKKMGEVGAATEKAKEETEKLAKAHSTELKPAIDLTRSSLDKLTASMATATGGMQTALGASELFAGGLRDIASAANDAASSLNNYIAANDAATSSGLVNAGGAKDFGFNPWFGTGQGSGSGGQAIGGGGGYTGNQYDSFALAQASGNFRVLDPMRGLGTTGWEMLGLGGAWGGNTKAVEDNTNALKTFTDSVQKPTYPYAGNTQPVASNQQTVIPVNVFISTPDASSFKASQTQINRALAAALTRAVAER